MSTNNISQKQIFSYLISTFHYWGIKSATQDTLKQAKKNLPSSVKQMKRTLFSLVLLHMFDYKIKVNDYVIVSDVKEDENDEIIMAYLAECQCPLLLEMKNQEKENSDSKGNAVEYFVGCNLQSSRHLLILCGWVMAVSDYFNQILPNAIQSRLNKIENPQTSLKAVQSLISNKLQSAQFKQQNQSDAQTISSLYKSVKAHMYQKDCYKQKRTKLKSRLEEKLQKLLNTSVPLDALLGSSSSQKQTKRQVELQEIIENEIQNMKERKYFWIWLQEKVMKETEQQIKQNNQLYQTYQQNQNNIIYDCQVDLQYLGKYIELCQYYEEKYNQLSAKMNQLKLTNKRFKEIQTQFNHEFKETLNRKDNSINKRHLFIALQLKSHLNVNLQKPKLNKDNQNQKDQNNNKSSTEMSKKHKKEIKKYLQSIEDAIKFI